MNYYESIYPNLSDRVLVTRTDDKLYEEVEKDLRRLWYFEYKSPWAMYKEMPPLWQKFTSAGGGIPPNVAVGLRLGNNLTEVADLLAVRSKFSYLVLHQEVFTLKDILTPWRCLNCGRRGHSERPPQCPSGSICMGEKMGPRIQFVVDLTEKDHHKKACEHHGTKYWPGENLEINYHTDGRLTRV